MDAPVCKDDARQGPILLIRDAFRRQPAEEGRVGAERQKQADPEGGVGQTAPLVRRDAHVRHHRGIRQRMVREGMRRGAPLRARARGLAAQAPDEGRDRAAAGRRSAAIVLESMQSRHEEETVQKTRAGADDQAGDRHAGRGLPGILPPVDPSRAAGGRAAHRRGLRTATQGHRPRPQTAVRAAFRDARSGRSGRIPARRDEDPGKPPSRTHPRTGLPSHQGTYRQVLSRQGSRHDALPRDQAPGTGPEPDDDPTAVPHREGRESTART